MSQIRFRDYQLEGIDALWYYFAHCQGHPLVAMPTATGKSLVITGFAMSVLHYYPQSRIMCLTHVKELIRQNAKKMLELWPQAPMGIYSAGLKRRDYLQNIIFAGIKSVVGCPELFGWIDILLIDESHLVSPNDATMYRKFIDALIKVNPKLKVVGFSATCWRTKTGHLTEGGLFTDIAYDLTSMQAYNRLVAEGWLTRLVPQPRGIEIDVSKVRTTGQDFNQKELQAAVDKPSITRRALMTACEAAADRNHWMVFGTGTEHCNHIGEMLQDEFDVPCVVVHNDMPDKERDRRIDLYQQGRVRAIVSNNILTTGFDSPHSDCGIILRPTKSSNLWVQMLGRLTRVMYATGFDLSTPEGRLAAIAAGPKPNSLILDFAGNTKRCGPINDPIIPGPPGKRKRKGDAPVKICEKCGTYCHSSLRYCDHCGAEFPIRVNIQEKSAGLELMRMEEPRVEVFDVERVTLHYNPPRGDKPPSIRVMYYSNNMLTSHREYVTPEHKGIARRRAEKWWIERAPFGVPCPATVAELLAAEHTLRIPKRIKVWVNAEPKPEIIGYE